MTSIVALTGGSGFVGRWVARGLIEAGTSVRMLVRDPSKFSMPDSATEIIEGDLADSAALARLVSGADCVVHLAGAVLAQNRQTFERINVAGTANLVDAATKAGISRFVHVSSMAAREPELSHYAASKRAGEAALIERAGEMAWVILRPPAVYGPGDKATLPLFAQLARRHGFLPGAALSRTSLIHVEDLAAALTMLAMSDTPAGTTHELDDGTAGGYSWRELVEIAGRAEGRQASIHHIPRPVMMAAAYAVQGAASVIRKPAILSPGKVRELYHTDWVARHNLLNEASGWRPAIDFATGFAGTLDWYRRHQWLPGSGGTARRHDEADHRETTV